MKLSIEGTTEEINKILQAIVSSLEQGEANGNAINESLGCLETISGIKNIPKGDIDHPVAESIRCNLSKEELDTGHCLKI